MVVILHINPPPSDAWEHCKSQKHLAGARLSTCCKTVTWHGWPSPSPTEVRCSVFLGRASAGQQEQH